MGIDLGASKIVTYNPAHQRRVITDPARKPPIWESGSLSVTSIFGRRKVSHDKLDGNPLIHALKGKFGYSMPFESYRQLIWCGIQIAPVALQGVEYDIVVPLPSSSNITAILAKRASRLNGNCDIVCCLSKATFGQVLEKAPAIGAVEKRHRRSFASQLHQLQVADASTIFEMKHVEFPLRNYFQPIIANDIAKKITSKKILLVDDILGSGTSINSAAKVLEQHGADRVSGLTLMGRLA